MPTVVNGIGTWYYGKRRIHTIKGTCEFCGSQTDLVSYDTTLFFVVVFVPLIPLGQRRILQQCAACQRHRVLSLAKWEEAKVRDGADLLEKLRDDPDNREAIMQALAFAIAYQNEPLFNNVAETLADARLGDAAIQAKLGDGYSYFGRWPDAERAYRASLAVEDNEVYREQLAWALLKQDQPDEARPYLQHVIDKRKRDAGGMVYFLIKGYQAQGRHDEALALMDQRDQAFPDWIELKEYQQQRKTSTRYRGTDTKVRSDFLSEGKPGYREGNWTARLPRWIAAMIALGAVAFYLGAAIWIGQARKVFLVNGTGQAYKVAIQGTEHALPPNSATPVRIAEGDVEVSFADARLGLRPVRGQIESSFWTRPFAGHTFVINPDRAAMVLEEETYYAKVAPPPGDPAKVHFGQAFYSLPGVDYEFQNFPPTLQVTEHSKVRKTRVGLATGLPPEVRLQFLQGLEREEQIQLCQRVLQLDPSDTMILYYLSAQLSPEETLKFVESRLDGRPILVEWHRVYQTQMERTHPQTDLRPRYRKLLADSKGAADALYLLGRVDPDVDEGDKLFQQAATADPPSGYAMYGLGYRAFSEARFSEARTWFEKALTQMKDKSIPRKMLHDALLASGDYDRLLQALQPEANVPGKKLGTLIQMLRVQAIRGDKDKARQQVAEVLKISGPQRDSVQQALDTVLACCENDVPGYLKAVGKAPAFEAALLRGELKQATDLAGLASPDSVAFHGLLYLEATRAGAKDIADKEWRALLADLGKGGRGQRLFGDVLTGHKPIASRLPQRLPLDPISKRVLLAVAAQRFPDQARELLTMARKLDFQHDAISLCLRKYLAQP